MNSGYASSLEKAHDAWYSSAAVNLQHFTGKLDIRNNIFYQDIPKGSDTHYPYLLIDGKSTTPAKGLYGEMR